MPSMDELRMQSRTVNLVIAERLGIDPSDIVNISGCVEPDGEYVRWESHRRVDRGFIQSCVNEAMHRDGA